MFLTVHAVAGQAMAQSAASPVAAFIIGFISHFFLDALPHGDESMGETHTLKQAQRQIMLVASIDLAFVVATQALLISSGILIPSIPVFAAGFAGMLPDALQLPFYFWKDPISMAQWYKKAHDRLHNLLGIRLGIRWGLVAQIITLALFIAAFR